MPTSCIYCGEIRDLTSDHVPPKNLFRSPRPDKPRDGSCVPGLQQVIREGRRILSRFAVLAPADKDREPIAAQLWKEKIIHGTLKRSPARKSVIRRSITSLDVHTPGGIYLGRLRLSVLVESDSMVLMQENRDRSSLSTAPATHPAQE